MKLKSFLIFALVAFLVAYVGYRQADSTPEALVKEYEIACAASNRVKAENIMQKMHKKYPNAEDWSDEQRERVRKSYNQLLFNTIP